MKNTLLKPISIILAFNLFLVVNSLFGQWQLGPSLNMARQGASAVTWNGSIYVFGGKTENSILLNTVENFDPNTGIWDETTVMPFNEPRFNASAVLFNGHIYLIGGRNSSNDVLKKVEKYDPVQNSWQEVHEMRREREGHSAVIYNSKIYVFGGARQNGDLVEVIEYYDDQVDEWEETNFEMTFPRAAHFSVVVNDTFYMFGGFYFGPTNSTFFLPASDTVWFSGPQLITARGNGATTQLGDSVFIMGGEKIGGDTESTEIYNLKTKQISMGPSISSPRNGSTAITLNDIIYLIGGFSSTLNQPLDLVEIYTKTPTDIQTPGEPSVLVKEARLIGFPNPFNGQISFELQIPKRGNIDLTIYDLQGRKIKTLYNGALNQGVYNLHWRAENSLNQTVSSGIYFAALKGDGFFQNFKIIYAK
jgi:N-acetylneuraminic acid mutarotase